MGSYFNKPLAWVVFIVGVSLLAWIFLSEGTPPDPGNTNVVCTKEKPKQTTTEDHVCFVDTICATDKNPKKGRFVSKGERICCESLEKIYGVPFKSVRPGWLRNPETGRSLELDCYNESMKIAVEYNGEQHYKWPNFTGQTKEQFLKQIRRDKYKKQICKKSGVYLIIVPYEVKHNKIFDYIRDKIPETVAE